MFQGTGTLPLFFLIVPISIFNVPPGQCVNLVFRKTMHTLDGTASDKPRPTIEIREAIADDAAKISAVLDESFREYRALYTDEGFAATALPREGVRRRMQEGPVWIALLNREIVGTASAIKKAGGIHIRGMAVLPAGRGHRIGELLLREIEAYALREGARRLFLSTTPFLDRAIRLYERCGFRRIGEGPSDLFGTPLFTMEKILDGLD